MVHAKARLAEIIADHRGEAFVVFDHQDVPGHRRARIRQAPRWVEARRRRATLYGARIILRFAIN